MKHTIKIRYILGIVLAFTATTALAQVNTIRIDENGNGFFNGLVMPGGLVAADPSGGVAGPVLIYTVPAAGGQLTIGDVLLRETTATNFSDVVRFWEFNQIIFYSDREASGAGDTDLADISGLPAQLLSLQVALTESGVEGNNGANYLALPGQPGWDGNPAGTQYQIISDVPEPGAFALVGLGMGTLLVLRRRR